MDEAFRRALGELRSFMRPSRTEYDQTDPMREIAGRFGPQTPMSRQGLAPDYGGEMRSYERPGSNSFEQQAARGVADVASMAGVPQAAGAIGNALYDPTIANVTDAGVRSALVAMKPLAAVKALGTGYGAAAVSDSGILGSSDANASDALDPGSRKRLEALQKIQAQGKTLTKAQREEQNAYLSVLAEAAKQQAGVAASTQAGEAKQKQDEYDRQVRVAESARDKELARNTRFSETALADVYRKTGGYTPMIAGAVAGGLTRAATGPGKVGQYALPMATGALAGITATNAPLAYNAYMTEPDNPERAAYQAYARELPPTHPRKQEYSDYAEGLPEENPVRTTARNELFNPWMLAERIGLGTLEGIGGGLAGSELMNLPRRAAREALRGPSGGGGGGRGDLPDSPGGLGGTALPIPPQTEMRRYPALGSPEREAIREGYRANVTGTGAVANPTEINKLLQSVSPQLPDVTNRVRSTNEAIDAFVAQNGRMPTTRREWEQFIYRNTGTLGIPAAVGMNALYGGEDQ